MSEIKLADIDHDLGHEGNMAGIPPQIIYGYQSDVATWPDEPAPPVGPAEFSLDIAGTLDGDVVMKAGKRAFSFDFTEDTGEFKINSVGETDGEHWEYALDIIKAKITAKVLGFANASQRKKMFFIVPDENGNYYLMGDKRRAPKLSTGGDGATTGKTSGDRNQVSMSWKYRRRYALVYAGDTENILVVTPES